jgi:hypothetical protein
VDEQQSSHPQHEQQDRGVLEVKEVGGGVYEHVEEEKAGRWRSLSPTSEVTRLFTYWTAASISALLVVLMRFRRQTRSKK